MRRLVNGRECEQCQIAQASTVRRDRNSDRAHLLLAQNRNKMQCDGLRNVWCSRSANNFCPAFRFQWFPIFLFFVFFSPTNNNPFPVRTVSFLVFPASPFSFCLFSHARHRLRNLSSASANCPQRRSCRGPSKQVVLLVLLSPRTPNARGIRCSRVYKYLRQRKCNFGESRRRKYNVPESSKAFARV